MSTKPVLLITGATGHLGFRTLVLALQAGYHTRVAIRKPDQAQKLLVVPSLKPFTSDITFVTVPDITAPGAYDSAIKGVQYVLHIASPIPTKPEHRSGSWEDIYYKPAVEGTLSVLCAAAIENDVKAVVITSSVAVIENRASPPVGPNDLKPVPTPEKANQAANFGEAYGTSKVLSFDAARRFISSEKLHFKTAFILPGYIQGPNALLTTPEEFFSSSNEGTINAILGNLVPSPRPTSQVWLDDVAHAHVAALTAAKVVNGDYLIVVSQGGDFVSWDEVAAIAEKAFPKAAEKGILKGVKGQAVREARYEVKESEEKLGFEFAKKEVWIKETAGWYLEWNGHKAE